MACIHLKHLFDLCQQNQLRISGPELVRIVCTQCGVQEECPHILMEEYDRRHEAPEQPAAPEAAKQAPR
ncbi:MAG: hypothetical protein U0836_15445 [Pirellulales bacterium]